jgi:hypothetical protein
VTKSKRTHRLRHRFADILLLCSFLYLLVYLSAYLVFFFWVPPWFPFDLLVALATIGLAVLIGDYKHKWWPIAPYKDKDHEIVLSAENRKWKDVK